MNIQCEFLQKFVNPDIVYTMSGFTNCNYLNWICKVWYCKFNVRMQAWLISQWQFWRSYSSDVHQTFDAFFAHVEIFHTLWKSKVTVKHELKINCKNCTWKILDISMKKKKIRVLLLKSIIRKRRCTYWWKIKYIWWKFLKTRIKEAELICGKSFFNIKIILYQQLKNLNFVFNLSFIAQKFVETDIVYTMSGSTIFCKNLLCIYNVRFYKIINIGKIT